MRLTKKFNLLFNVILFSVTIGISTSNGQSLTLEQCYTKAEELSPLKAGELYIATIDQLQKENTRSMWLPNLAIEGFASYQSEVFALPFSPPGVEVPEIPKDQYNIALNVQQRIYDGGLTKSTTSLVHAKSKVSAAELEVSLYKIREVIDELFFGLLTLQENLKVVQLFLNELDNQIGKARAGYDNGIVLQSVLDQLHKEKLLARQKSQEILIRINSLQNILEDWVGEEVSSLEFPQMVNETSELARPELQLFSVQRESLLLQSNLAKARTLPHLSAFVTGGLGQPNPLNFFETDFSSYYRLGATLRWNVFDWGYSKRESQILQAQSEIITTQEDHFSRALDNEVIRQQGEIERLQLLVETDQELVDLQARIAAEAKEQNELGVLSSTDYVTILTEQQELQLKSNLHRIELAKARVQLKNITGN